MRYIKYYGVFAMKKDYRCIYLILNFLIVACIPQDQIKQEADLILTNARVYTMQWQEPIIVISLSLLFMYLSYKLLLKRDL